MLSVHELHIWQLSESKIVASVHVMASRDHDFMPVAVEIRKALHHHGIHSSTIQPEYPPPSPHVIPDDQLKVRRPAGSVKAKLLIDWTARCLRIHLVSFFALQTRIAIPRKMPVVVRLYSNYCGSG